MKFILLLIFLINISIYAMDVPLTNQQAKEAMNRYKKDSRDFSKFGFTKEDRMEYCELDVYMEEAFKKEKLTDFENQAFERMDALQNQLLKAIRAKKTADAKNNILLNYVKHFPEKTEQMKKIIKAGADVNAKDKYGMTPLYYAIEKNLPIIEKILIDEGADTSGTKNLKQAMHTVDTALSYYKQKKYKEASKYFVEAFKTSPSLSHFGDNNEYINALIQSYKQDADYTQKLLQTIELGNKYHFEEVLAWMVKLEYNPTSPLLKKSIQKEGNQKYNCEGCLNTKLLKNTYLDKASTFIYAYDEKYGKAFYNDSKKYLNHIANEPYLVFGATVAKAKTAQAKARTAQEKQETEEARKTLKKLDEIGNLLKIKSTK